MKSEKVRTDEGLEALFSHFKLPDLEGLKCKKANKVQKMCVNSKCTKFSLMCQDPRCEYCGDRAHKYCQTVKIGGITELLSNITGKQKEFNLDLSKIQEKFIDDLISSKVPMIKKYCFGDISEKNRKIVQEIYQKKNDRCLVGQEAEELFRWLMKSNQDLGKHGNALLEQFSKAMQEFLKNITKLKNQLYEAFINSWKLKTDNFFEINSRILNKRTCIQDIQEIQKHNIKVNAELDYLIQSLGNPKKLQLIFRASEHSFKAEAFHEYCGEVPNTVTIIKTEYGKIIAGYTRYRWHSVPNKNYVSDPFGETFLLILDLKQKLVPFNNNKLIYNDSNYGPVFGNGYDIFIDDECHLKHTSYAGETSAYNTQFKYYNGNQTSYTAMTGSIKGYHFKVTEYEVFKVIK